MTFFGDGATSEGDFHEAMNCAAVYQCPVVFVCQNNQWAISIPLAKQTHTATLAQKALEKEVQKGIQNAIDAAEKLMQELGNPLDIFDHLYAELPPRLQAQKAALAHELENRDREDHHG